MSDHVPVTEVFADVDPDPDAVIESFGADSLEELVDGPGDHEPTTDEEIADIDAAAELLGELADATLDCEEPDPATTADDDTELDAVQIGSAGTSESGGDAGGEPTSTVMSDATVDVLPGDGETIGEFLGLEEPAAVRTHERDGLVLVGPEPMADRVSNETFGAGVDDVSGSDGDSRRTETELASSVFNWAS